MRDPRLAKLADVLVNYSVAVKKGQIVRLAGPAVAQPLILEIFRAVVQSGGHPLVRMSTDELQEIFLKHAADEQLKFCNPINLFETERIDCSISIWADENTRCLTNCDCKKMGLAQAARKPIMEM